MSWSPESIRQQFPILCRKVHGRPLRYLDNAATTFSPDCVLQATAHYEKHYRSNVQRGVYQLGAESTEAYEAARLLAAKYLNAHSGAEIIFTPGTTFAVNLLAECLGQGFQPGDEVLVSVAEHHSNFVPWQRLCERYAMTLKLIPVLENGSLDLTHLDELITDRCRIVAVSHISNVTGSISDLNYITTVAHRKDALVFVDGAQAAPHGPIDVQALDVDFYAFSGHKSYGPTGVGVLWGREKLLDQLPPFLTGGGMIERVTAQKTRYLSGNRRFEAGTPAVAQAIGLGAALEWLMTLPWHEIRLYERKLTERLLQGLSDTDGLHLLGESSPDLRAPIFSFDIKGCHAHDICQILDEHGVALRGGHHCAQPLMDALGLLATSRASFAVFNNEDDIEALLAGLGMVLQVLR